MVREPGNEYGVLIVMTKNERKKLAREIINKYLIDEEFTKDDARRFSELCGYRFESVVRCEPFRGSGPSVSVQCNDEGYSGRWSWVKSIDGYSERQNMLQAMRAAIRYGLFGNVEKDRCARCGASERLTVDHKSVSFARIAAKFTETHGIPRLVNVGNGWQLRDDTQFIAFHDSVADYQVLCVSCNAKKGGAS